MDQKKMAFSPRERLLEPIKEVESDNRLKQRVLAILASLPSRQAQTQGHKVVRQKLLEERTQSLANIGLSKPKSSMTTALDRQLEIKGLTIDFQNDGRYDELDRIKQLDVIKQMTVSIGNKKRLRDKLFAQMPVMKDKSCAAFCHRQADKRLRCQSRTKLVWDDFQSRMTLWNGAFKSIEGNFGSGVLSYFRFLKYIFLMNFVLCLKMAVFIIVPMIIFPKKGFKDQLINKVNDSSTGLLKLAANCSARYDVNTSGVWYDYLADFMQGTGFLEKTVLFYGYYVDEELDFTHAAVNYNMPLAYLTTVMAVFVVSLTVMATLSAEGFRQRLFSEDDTRKSYFKKVFTFWDYSLNYEKSTKIKHNSFYRDIVVNLEQDYDNARRKARSTWQLAGIWSIRIIINLVVTVILGAAAYLIYYCTVQSIHITKSKEYKTFHPAVRFLVEYMTPLAITALNSLIPMVMARLIKLEDYSNALAVNLTLGRTVFLRLASLAALLFSLYVSITCKTKDFCNVGTGDECTPIECWETYAGQEFYKLVITDFVVVLGMTIFVEIPRKLIVSNYNCYFTRMVGHQKFDISKEVLGLVYSQTVMWLGLFFCPMLPAITLTKNFIFFYIKMGTTLKICKPSLYAYNASDSERFFQVLLITSFTLCVAPVLYVMFRMDPSRGCGPFRIYYRMVDILTSSMITWPPQLKYTLNLLLSTCVILVVVIALIVTVHHLRISIGAYKDMILLLKEQLYMEVQDKQFLVARLHDMAGNTKKEKTKMVAVDVESPSLEPCLPGSTTPI